MPVLFPAMSSWCSQLLPDAQELYVLMHQAQGINTSAPTGLGFCAWEEQLACMWLKRKNTTTRY